jgi:hypothetical protein
MGSGDIHYFQKKKYQNNVGKTPDDALKFGEIHVDRSCVMSGQP